MARKSKKVDYVNVNDMGQQTATMLSIPKKICYKAGL